MVEIFNSITNIAKKIENDIFTNFAHFQQTDSQTTMQKNILQHCSALIKNEFKQNSSIKSIISQDTKKLQELHKDGKYLISYLSIDSIQLIDLNFSLGSLFAIYEEQFEANQLQAVVYITYGPTFQIVFASKEQGVVYYTYQNNHFIKQDSLILNKKGKINSPAGIRSEFSVSHQKLIDQFFNDGYRLRLSNSLILDTHQILFKKGGIYSSPITTSHPEGSLDVIFEAFPIAFIIELAQGEAIDSKQRILDIKSPTLTQKTPIYFGSKDEITQVKKLLLED